MTSAGKPARGSVSADSARAARARMRGDGVFVTEIRETAGHSGAAVERGRSRWNPNIQLFQGVPALELALATRQLATLVGAGIPLVEALGALVEQVEHGRLKTVIDQVRDRVNEGSALADALENAGPFDALYVSMIRAGEEGGALDLVLRRVADHLEAQVRLKNKVTSILVYPAVMLVFALFVVAALVTVVLPQITELLLSLDRPLPFYTRWIIASSDFARDWWWAMGLGGVAASFAVRALGRTRRGRRFWDVWRLRLPVVGRLGRLIAIARFTRTLSTLLAGGVTIVRALAIARHVVNNVVLADAIDSARSSIVEGATVARPLRESGQFPPLVTHMIDVGERSGQLEAMLSKVAETYDEQVETSISKLTSLLEPFLILLMVGLVLVIILATLMPLLQITGSFA